MGGWNKKFENMTFDTSEHVHDLEFATSTEAWEKLND